MLILLENEKDKDEDNKNKILILIVLVIVDYYFIGQYEKISYRALFLNENSYVIDLFLSNYSQCIQKVMQMFLPMLHQLKRFLSTNIKLGSLQKVRLLKKIAIFIDILGNSASNKKVQKHFQYSGSIVSFCL